MKLIWSLYCAAFLATAFIFVGGCATPVVLSPAQPASTNAVTGVVTPAMPAVVTNVPNATGTKIISYGESVTPLLPAPYSNAANAVLGLATIVLGWIAARKNGQLNTANQVSTAIIQGVESAGTAAAAVKTAVATVSKANGVSDAVESAVNKVTGSQ